MNFFPVIALIVLFSACTDYEDRVKDLRNHDIVVDDEFSEEDTSDETITNSTDTNGEVDNSATSDWSYKVTLISENNWGYQLLEKGVMKINQTTIPSVQGINGFDTEEKAERAAQYILNKVENGIFPPTVNKEELENLGVLRD